MEHNNKIRQEFRDKTETMVMGYTHDGIPFSSEYVLWLEDELNKLRIGGVSVSLPSVDDAGAIAVEISEINNEMTAQEQAFFIAGFSECVKYLEMQSNER